MNTSTSSPNNNNANMTAPSGIGSSPIGRASSPAPPPAHHIAGLPNKPSSATTRYSLGHPTSPGGPNSTNAGGQSGGPGSAGSGSAGNRGSIGSHRSPNLNNSSGLPGSGNAGAGLRPASELLSGYSGGGGAPSSPLYPSSAGAGQRHFSPNTLSLASAAQFASSPNTGGLAPSASLGSGLLKGTPEADAIDKWFEDLQHYEATLEEMAAASLDQNFKEELSAIEQWFRVLSEAERTAALYSLLQESTQVQIRFFITVLQQMARSDPVSALLSPGGGHNSLMAEQMENKLASLGLKSPNANKSPAPGSSFRPQSEAAASFLSPNSAAAASGTFGNAANKNAQGAGTSGSSATDAHAAGILAAQRARLKSNRTSAPGHLAAIGSGDRSNFAGLTLDNVHEGGRPVSPGLASPGPDAGVDGSGAQMATVRPKSTDGLTAARLAAAAAAAGAAGGSSPRPNGPLDDSLSPLISAQGLLGAGGPSWASMMNTPMMPMFNEDQAKAQDTIDAATFALNNVKLSEDGSQQQKSATGPRKSGQPGAPPINLGSSSNLAGVQGVLSGMYDQGNNNQQGAQLANLPNVSGVSAAQLSAALSAGAGGLGAGGINSAMLTAGLSPNVGAAQWVNQQNDFLRSPLASALAMSPNALAGLQSPSGGLANPVNMQIMNAMAAMGGSVGNLSAAQFLALQQQILQQQQQVAAATGQFAGVPMSAGLANSFGNAGSANAFGSGLRSAGPGRNAFGGPGLSVGTGNTRDKPQRSPRVPGSNLPQSARSATFAGAQGGSGGAGGEEEVADLATLNDTAAWLRQLRLHKYTPNFENDHWKDMVLMDDKALEAKGVAALGARRKMLKTFELVRAKYDIKLPGEDDSAAKKDGTTSGSPTDAEATTDGQGAKSNDDNATESK